MTIPEVEWPILPDGYRWRVNRQEYPTEFGPIYSEDYYIFIEKKHTWMALRWFKKVKKTRWSASIMRKVEDAKDTPATVLTAENIEYSAYKAFDDLETLFAKREAEDKFFGTHP